MQSEMWKLSRNLQDTVDNKDGVLRNHSRLDDAILPALFPGVGVNVEWSHGGGNPGMQ